MKLGVFGGTFNPIHYGHLINAEMVREKFLLDKILFIPAKVPVHKELGNATSAEDRYNMIKLAIQQNEYFEASRIEIERKEPSYTIYTIKEILNIYPVEEIHLIIGVDTYYEIEAWKDCKELLNMVSLIVMDRPVKDDQYQKINAMSCKYQFAKNKKIEISSTDIRNKLYNKKSVKYLLPDEVINYIQTKGLYQS